MNSAPILTCDSNYKNELELIKALGDYIAKLEAIDAKVDAEFNDIIDDQDERSDETGAQEKIKDFINSNELSKVFYHIGEFIRDVYITVREFKPIDESHKGITSEYIKVILLILSQTCELNDRDTRYIRKQVDKILTGIEEHKNQIQNLGDMFGEFSEWIYYRIDAFKILITQFELLHTAVK